MKLINKILKPFNLTWVIRKQYDLNVSLKPVANRVKQMLIFAYKTNQEKILFETSFINK
jgi:hypothetical protein